MTSNTKPAQALTDYIATIMLARDLATGRGKNSIDLADLFLALSADAGATGHTLRSCGATQEVLEEATIRADQGLLQELGITEVPALKQLPELAGYTITDRTQRLLERAKNPRELALAIVNEPSGSIEEILTYAGLEKSALQKASEDLPLQTLIEPTTRSAHPPLSASYRIFLPVDSEQIWQFISDPSNLIRWLPALETLDAEPGSPGPWVGTSLSDTEGKQSATSAQRKVRQVSLLVKDIQRKQIVYELSFPHSPHLNVQEIEALLEKTAGGCICQISTQWLKPHKKKIPFPLRMVRKSLGLLVGPINSHFVSLQAIRIAHNLRKATQEKPKL